MCANQENQPIVIFPAVSYFPVATPAKDNSPTNPPNRQAPSDPRTRRGSPNCCSYLYLPIRSNITTFHLHDLTAPTGNHHRSTITKFHPHDTPSTERHDVRRPDQSRRTTPNFRCTTAVTSVLQSPWPSMQVNVLF